MRTSAMTASDDQQLRADKLEQRIAFWRRDPGNAHLYRECAELASSLQRYDLLLELADRAVQLAPTDAAARFDKANALIGLRDYRAALQVMAELQAASDEQDIAVTANRALCHYCLREYDQALPHLQRNYARDVRTPGALRMLVTSHHHLGQMDEAVAIAGENSAAAQQDAALAGAYALAYFDADNVAQAAQWARTALRLNPASIDGRITEAFLLILRMQLERADQMFATVLQDAAEVARAWIGAGTVALLQQDLKRARSNLERGVQLMPGHVGSWHLLGWTQLMLGDRASAEQTFEQALSLDRNFAETHGALAGLDALRGDAPSAQRRIEIALRLDPQCLSAKYAAALLADPTLKNTQSRELLQGTLMRIAGGNQSALSQLLVKNGKR